MDQVRRSARPRKGVSATRSGKARSRATNRRAFTLVRAQAADCAECAGLLVEQLREHRIRAAAQPLARVLRQIVADARRGFVLAARAEGRLVGVAYVAIILSAEHAGPVAWLEEVYVTPAWRGLGIGSALLTAVLKRVRSAGVVAVDLETDARHLRAATLYKRFGFRPLNRSRWVKKLAR